MARQHRRSQRLGRLVAGAAMVALGLPPTAAGAEVGPSELVSVNGAGTDSGDGPSFGVDGGAPSVSADGRYVVFLSDADDLGPTDPGADTDVYRRDLLTGITELVSVNDTGDDGANAAVTEAIISENGRYVAFVTTANNFGPPDAGADQDIYIRDMDFGFTQLASVNAFFTDGGNGASYAPKLSPNGRYALFTSEADDLAPPDTNEAADVYIHDRFLGFTRLVSVNAAGDDAGNGASGEGSLSVDGRFVAFTSAADDLGPADANSAPDVYLRDLALGFTELVSVNAAGTDGGDGPSGEPLVSESGRYVAFASRATDLGPADGSAAVDVYFRDRGLDTTALVSATVTGPPGSAPGVALAAMSPDGRYVLFQSDDNRYGPADSGVDTDVYLRDTATDAVDLVTINAAGTDGMNNTAASFSALARMSADARFVVFRTLGNTFGPPDAGADLDVYVRDRAAGVTALASRNGASTDGTNDAGAEAGSISASGRLVAFTSWGDSFGPVDTNEAVDVYAVATLGADPAVCGRLLQPGPGAIVGTPGNDTIIGTPGDDVIFALGGHDTVDGGGGDDIVVGGDGNDSLAGGGGNDVLCGQGGHDRLSGDDGDDGLSGGDGNDRLRGGAGVDILLGGAGYDFLDGGAHGAANDGGTEADFCVNGTNTNCP